MSLILDALRKSEAEREIGQVPGLRAQTLRLDDPPPEPPARPGGVPWAWAVAGGAGALLVLAAGWMLGQATGAGEVPAAPAAAAQAPEAVLPAPTPMPPATVSAAPPAPADGPSTASSALPSTTSRPATATAGSSSSSSAPAPASAKPAAPPPAAPAIERRADAVASPRPEPVRPPPKASPPPPPRPAEPVARTDRPASPAPAAAALPTLDQLPDDVRRNLPALVVNGSSYSADPASRMLIVDGQVVHEGGAAGPGVIVESIAPRSAVLRVGERRFRLAY
jgi:general secretion pathway protein B